jgi:hypothetical protein
MGFGFEIEGVIGEVIGVKVGFDGLEIRHDSRDMKIHQQSIVRLKRSETTSHCRAENLLIYMW